MSKFKTVVELNDEINRVPLDEKYDNFHESLENKEYISKEDLYRILEDLSNFDCYHKLGKVNVWRMSNDEVVDATQELLIKTLREELEK